MINKSNEQIRISLVHVIDHSFQGGGTNIETKQVSDTCIYLEPKEKSNSFYNEWIAKCTCSHCNEEVKLTIEQVTVALIPEETVNKILNSSEEMAKAIKSILLYTYSYWFVLWKSFIRGLITFVVCFIFIAWLSPDFPLSVRYVLYTFIFPFLFFLIIFTAKFLFANVFNKNKKTSNRPAIVKISNYDKSIFNYLFSLPGVIKKTIITSVKTKDCITHYVAVGDKNDGPDNLYISIHSQTDVPYSDEIERYIYIRSGFL